jgi:hypothetical protein
MIATLADAQTDKSKLGLGSKTMKARNVPTVIIAKIIQAVRETLPSAEIVFRYLFLKIVPNRNFIDFL